MTPVEIEDPPLPPGYVESPERRCFFEVDAISGGYKGLSLAILLRAVKDGCNAEWMKEIAEAYEIDLPEGMLDRKPGNRVVLDKTLTTYITTDVPRAEKSPLLAWGDGVGSICR